MPRKFEDWWYEVRNPFPKLKEYWYQRYVSEHPSEFGFSDLRGPNETGPDFTATMNGETVAIEVEKDYLSYKQHGHPVFDVLIVGVLDEPPDEIRKSLPPVILHLDPQEVMDWSEPMRKRYKVEITEKHRLQKQWIDANISDIAAYKLRRDGTYEVVMKDRRVCECGGTTEKMAVPFDDMTEGQMADYLAGSWDVFVCLKCGHSEYVKNF